MSAARQFSNAQRNSISQPTYNAQDMQKNKSNVQPTDTQKNNSSTSNMQKIPLQQAIQLIMQRIINLETTSSQLPENTAVNTNLDDKIADIINNNLAQNQLIDQLTTSLKTITDKLEVALNDILVLKNQQPLSQNV